MIEERGKPNRYPWPADFGSKEFKMVAKIAARIRGVDRIIVHLLDQLSQWKGSAAERGLPGVCVQG
jgi:hypothetical protein